MCPGRGKFAVCRIRVLKIWREDVRKIGEADAKAEGFTSSYEFLGKWMSINSKNIYRLTDEELAAGLYHVDDDSKLVTPTARWGFYRGHGKGYDFLTDEQAYHRLLWDMPIALFDAWALKFERI